MKRVLIITYYWPPTGGSGVQRWVKFAKYLPSQGWQPVIYTPENPEQLAVDESLLKDIPAEAEIVKTHITEPYNLYRKLFGGRKKSSSGAGVNPLNAQKKSWRQRLAVFLRGNLFIPDPRVAWVRPSVSYLKKYLREHPVDVIVTTGPPQSMHLIGLGLSKAAGIPWVADFRDPWTEMFYFKHLALTRRSERRHRHLEKKVLDGASVVISVTPLVQADFQANTSTPVELVTNGFDTSDFPQDVPHRSSGKFTIVHTGLFASDGNPLALWDALARKCVSDPAFDSCLQIRLAGKTDAEIIAAIRAAGLGDKLTDLGYLPHSGTVEEQRGAELLILPLRQEPEYRKVLPGKIFEYLASRRPVLGIGQPDGAAATVLRETRSGVMLDWNDAEGISAQLDEAWERYKSGASAGVDSDISAYTREMLTARLVSIFERI